MERSVLEGRQQGLGGDEGTFFSGGIVSTELDLRSAEAFLMHA
jgi:hypothetical protein